MPNKESKSVDAKMSTTALPAPSMKTAAAAKVTFASTKSTVKDIVMSPGSVVVEDEPAELLGSLTTQQQQRTSARVIKKLLLPQTVEIKREIIDCETPNKIEDKDPLKFPTVKQRMPKALWSADEKSLFFEALNEYGKDFDAITSHICAKMKKKGMLEANLKTKTQVSHFYYRTWHKLSKHVRFDENVKKVAQELYALINYGELRKKLVAVNEKTCARLGEMVRVGSIVVRARGKNVRVRTPMCRALRNLNQITERVCGARVCSRATVLVRARDRAAWCRVQGAAHNPRVAAALPLRTALHTFIAALSKRWKGGYKLAKKQAHNIETKVKEEVPIKETEENHQNGTDDKEKEEKKDDLESHLNLITDRMIVQEQKLPKVPVLHLGPRPGADIHIPVVSPGEQLSSQKICFASYLERMCRRDKECGPAKIRTPKRQRKDSASEKEKETETKKFKIDESEPKLMHIDETAVDGIEMITYMKNNLEESTEDEKEIKDEEMEREKEIEREKDASEKEKDSFSEMEDDEKFNKSDTDNESDHKEKRDNGRTFKNLKVKFRIRPKKRGGSIYTLVMDKDPEETKPEDTPKVDEPVKLEGPAKEPVVKISLPVEEEPKPDIDLEMAIRQIRKGWSVYDAGDLTIGDLYLMFGSRSRLELDYWWSEPTPPLVHKNPDTDKPPKERRHTDKEIEEKIESDSDLLSPKNVSQDSNDGLSGDERKNEQLASPEHKSSTLCGATLRLTNKLINRPTAPKTNDGFSLLSDRLKRLLALAGNMHVTSSTVARCDCGHVCPQQRRQGKQHPMQAAACAQITTQTSVKGDDAGQAMFRHPTPIAPKPEHESQKCMSLDGLPRWRRGRPRLAEKRVVVQRLLPLLPKLPPANNLIPVKLSPNCPPAPPRILPKPPACTASDKSILYVLSDPKEQKYFHEGETRVPSQVKTPLEDLKNEKEDYKTEASETEVLRTVISEPMQMLASHKPAGIEPATGEQKTNNPDITNFLPMESMSLSPSRLLRDAECWLEGAGQDFSLSSFLGHLEGRPPPDPAVDSQLQSLMAETSVDYVAKFADLAAEVTDERN